MNKLSSSVLAIVFSVFLGNTHAVALEISLDEVTSLPVGWNFEALASDAVNVYAAEIISDNVIRLGGSSPYPLLDSSVFAGQWYGIAFESTTDVWLSGNSFLSKRNIFTGSTLQTVSVPNGTYGLTWQNGLIYAANFATDTIYLFDSTGTAQGSFPAPFSDTREVLSDGTNLFAFDQNSDLLYQIDPISGFVIDSTNLPFFDGGVAQALAFHNHDLLVYGLFSNSIYRYQVKTSNPVPEPTTMLLFGTGIAGLAVTRLRKKKQ